MSHADCPNLVLVEARGDGRLAATDVASLERHLRTCAECASHADELDRIGEALRQGGDERISQLDHRRARANLLRAAAAPVPRARARSVFVWAPAAAMVAAAAIVAFVVLPGSNDEGRDTPAPVASFRTETKLFPEAGAQLDRRTDGDVDRVDLRDGAVRAEVRKLREGERFVVHTRDAEVEVRGTILRVEAQDGALRSVDVEEGVVEVRVGDAKWRVEAGGHWRPAARDTDAAKTGAPPSPQGSSSPAVLPANASSAAASPPPHAAPSIPSASAVGSAPSPAPSSSQAAAARSRSLQEAIAAIERGDYGQASKTLEKAGATETDPERAELAKYLQSVALQRAGRPDDARRAARDYLAAHPTGRFVREAQRIAETP